MALSLSTTPASLPQQQQSLALRHEKMAPCKIRSANHEKGAMARVHFALPPPCICPAYQRMREKPHAVLTAHHGLDLRD